MKKRIIILIFMVCLFFSMESISASSNLIKTETKNKVMFIKDKNDSFSYSWSFDKEEYNKKEFDFDLEINFSTPNKKKIESIIKEDVKAKYISFNYHGNLPSKASIKVPVSDMFKDGNRLNLYYYNENKDEIELITTSVKVINGYVTFEIEHCSDYFLTMSIVKEASNTSNNGVVIIAMLVVIVILIGYTLTKNKK